VIAVVVLTHNRVHLLRQCVENVLLRTSSATQEIVVWNNGSVDGTREYLDSLAEPRLRVVHHPENIGQNAYARAFRLTSSDYMVEMDDDIIDAPEGWDETLLDAFRRLPKIGYLAASLVDDPNDSATQYMKYLRESKNAYVMKVENGIRILEGPTGGGCTMTSRTLYDRVGGFREHKKLAYWHEDAAYVKAIEKLGYRAAFLADLEVWHAGGRHYSEPSQEKAKFHEHQWKIDERKDKVKRVILRLPYARALNERYRWFDAPDREEFRAWLEAERAALPRQPESDASKQRP
jgi:GT2 family glycosyltransferase